MKQSTQRILTTHVGSLPRPPDLLAMIQAKEQGEPFDAGLYASRVKSMVADVVKRQTFTTDIEAYYQHIDARMEYCGDALSTSTAVEVRRLSHPDFLIEVEVIAVVKG